jgi:hypothetical protein
MNILVFDTETVDVEHAFCYNVGYTIVNIETREKLLKRDYVIEQVWENKMLFSTSYYAEKKQLYINALRGRKASIKHWGHTMQRMIKDIQDYNVEFAYAFNSPFDVRVFDFNSEWFKTSNALDYVQTIDIRGLINQLLFSDEYKAFCEENGYYTESGNYSGNAETLTKFIRQDIDFVEDHTALSDSLIEADIILYMIDKFGVDITKEGKVYATVPRETEREMVIVHNGVEHKFTYLKKLTRNGITTLKDKDFVEQEKEQKRLEEIAKAERRKQRELKKLEKQQKEEFVIED